MKADSTCAKGHVWHKCLVHPRHIVQAPADHENMEKCSCKPGVTFLVGLCEVEFDGDKPKV